jgi:hypothetical protein
VTARDRTAPAKVLGRGLYGPSLTRKGQYPGPRVTPAAAKRIVVTPQSNLQHSCITRHRHSEVVQGLEVTTFALVRSLTCMFPSPLQGKGRRFESLSAHERTCCSGAWSAPRPRGGRLDAFPALAESREPLLTRECRLAEEARRAEVVEYAFSRKVDVGGL